MRAQQFRGVALNPMGYPHYTDHLAAVAVLLDIPLLFTDVEHYEQALRHYPNLKVELVDWQDFRPESLVPRYNALFISDMWPRNQVGSRFASTQLPENEQLRVVHCPHGFSDKGFWFAECVEQDLTLVYGQNMLDLIAYHRPEADWDRYVITGNLRYAYYKQHADALDALVQEEVLAQFVKSQPTLLYAPTWRDAEGSTSFFVAAQHILEHLPDSYNLIVKLHPNLENDQDLLLHVYEIISKYEERPNVLFLSDFPLIYPLLATCCAYIGDRSAIGYDFLAFDRPMFFINHQDRDILSDRGAYLFRCGKVIKPDAFDQLFKQLDQALTQKQDSYSKVRQEMYSYTFASERSLSESRFAVQRACSI